MIAAYQCQGCGAQFEEGQVKPVFQCSLTHREPYRGSGYFVDCPACGKFEGLRDLRQTAPAPSQGPRLREIKVQPLFDNETPVTERRACGHEHHRNDGVCIPLSKVPEGPAPRGVSRTTAMLLGMAAALAPEPIARPARIAGQEQCTSCGMVEEHAPDCRPPRGYRKVT